MATKSSYKTRSSEVDAHQFTTDTVKFEEKVDENGKKCRTEQLVCVLDGVERNASGQFVHRSDPSTTLAFGDWVVRHADGSVSIMSGDEFAATHEVSKG